jgi:HlyD family secretion protein
MRWLFGVMAAAAIAAGAWGVWQWRAQAAEGPGLRTAEVEIRDLLVQITATGTLEPEEVIDVGAQVAGRIESLGQDPTDSGKTIDYRSEVDAGTVLALIDPAVYQAQVEQAQAMVEQAQAQQAQANAMIEQGLANVQRAEADLVQLNARLVQAEREWKRTQQLYEQKKIISESEYDLAKAAVDTARANVEVGKATLAQAKASSLDANAAVARAKGAMSDAQANLKRAEINLGYCTIKSPVHGVIVDRRVNVGQTVVASLNAPSLFLIAKDLRRMQIWASVNEADIGQIHPGQPVRFTVDAFPDEEFTGEVAQIRLNANMTQNVVTYTVVVAIDNSDGRLLPYLTANVQFEVARKPGALAVPNAALRWQPPADLVVAEANAATDAAAAGKGRGKQATVWVPTGGKLRPVAVDIGLSDGVYTEIVGGPLQAGDAVAVGIDTSAAGNVANPFVPQMFGGRRQAAP